MRANSCSSWANQRCFPSLDGYPRALSPQSNPPKSPAAVDEIVSREVLHEQHHALFWALVEMAKEGTQQLWLGVDSEEVFDATEDAWQVCGGE